MLKKVKGIIALILAVCALQCGFAPIAYAAEAEVKVVYDFVNDYPGKNKGGIYDKLYHYREDFAGEAENDIAADYAAEKNDWKIESYSGYANYDSSYVTVYTGVGCYLAIRFRVRESGNYNLSFNYIATDAPTTSAAPSQDSKLYIFQAEKEVYTQGDIRTATEHQLAFGSANFYSNTFDNKYAKTDYSLEAGKEYIFVMKAGANASALTTSQLYIKKLTLTKTGEYDPPASQGKTPQPILVKEQVTNVWKDGTFAAITNVNGRDYLAIPVYGGKMYVCDLDAYQVIAEIDTGISTPRGATVDSQGNIWVGGPETYLFKYNPYTHEGTRTKNFTGSEIGVSSGSSFAITEGDDGCLYFGTYSSAYVLKYDPIAEVFTKIDYKEKGFKYATAVVKKGDYIYTSLHKEGDDGVAEHYLLKMDAVTYETVAMLDIAPIMSTQRYLTGLQWLDDTRLIGSGTGVMFVVDTEQMRIVTAEEFGTDGSLKGNISEVRDNKVYFTTGQYGMYAYDQLTQKASYVMGSGGMLGMKCNSGNFVTLNVKDGKVVPKSEGGEEKEYLIAFSVSNIVMSAIDPVGKTSISLRDLLDPNAGESVSIRALENGLPGSNEILTGTFQSNLTYAYNIETGNISTYKGDGIQTDAIHWYNDILYVGNYTLGQLTQINPETNKPKALITLNDDTFDQSRIHTITSGDNKVFVGTIPDVYEHGGMIAWYDFSKNRAYAAIGPNPEDVYYSNNNVTWYNEVTGKLRVEDTSDDAVPGVIKDQSIICLTYHNGLLYGTSSVQGGTAAKGVSGTSVLFVYDVSRRQVVATSNLSEIGAKNVKYVAGVAADPDVNANGKFWGIVAETLFSFTYNPSTRTFNFKTELAFDKAVNSGDGRRFLFPRPMRFYEGYLYVSFGTKGNFCKIDLNDPTNYQKIMPETDDLSDLPDDYTIAEDGNLYFLTSTSIHMITLNPTEAEWEKAQVVDNLIAGLQPISTEKVNAVNAAYNALTNREKSLVQNMDAFRDVETAYMEQRIDAMAALPGCSAAYTRDIRADFDNLPRVNRANVGNISKLISAEVNLMYAEESAPVVADANSELYYFEDITTAVAAMKETGVTITLRADVTAPGYLLLKQGISLDLSGHTLIAEGMITFDGTVYDSVGTGLLQVQKDAFRIKYQEQTQVAVWDQTSQGYRFTDVTFQVMRQNAADGDTAKFYFLPDFTNPMVRDLIMNGQVGDDLAIRTEISWDEGRILQTFRFAQKIVDEVYGSFNASTGSYRNVFLLTVTGIAGLDDLKISAVVDAGNGTCAATDPI